MAKDSLSLIALDRVRKLVFYTLLKLTGYCLTVDVEYTHVSLFSADFPVATANIQPLLPSSRLRPVEHRPQMTSIRLSGNDLSHVRGVPGYGEVVIAVPVECEGAAGIYCLYLPVSREEARWYGVDALGANKFIAQVDFDESPDMRCCRLSQNGRDILTFEVPKIPTRHEVWHNYLYGVARGEIVRTPILYEGERGVAEQAGARYTLGDHPIADKLRSLEIGSQSIRCEQTPSTKFTLHRPDAHLPL